MKNLITRCRNKYAYANIVLRGLVKPTDCPLFGKVCTPNHAVGSCMVSVEGTCAAWYKYGSRVFHFE